MNSLIRFLTLGPQFVARISNDNVNGVLFQQVRSNVRWNFEKCSEIKRIRTHGWKKRISTPSGRNIIMRRILKGRQVLSH